jgi:hypothetical protein
MYINIFFQHKHVFGGGHEKIASDCVRVSA